MEDHIFFKDKNNVLKGPFTERQVQEWYRQKWFDSSFPFYFTHGNKRPSDVENSGVTLDELRSYNGIGCPFREIDESKKNEELKRKEEGRKKLEKIEQEIADLKPKCAAILAMEKSLEQMENKLEGLAASQIKNLPKPVEKTSNYEEIGNAFADYILSSLEQYDSGIFLLEISQPARMSIESALNEGTGEEKAAKIAACERILVEKMKEKECFYCVICNADQYNYKQALIHFTSREHHEKQHVRLDDGATDPIGVRHLLATVTKLAPRLAEEDAKIEQERREKYGFICRQDDLLVLRPTNEFLKNLSLKYCDEFLDSVDKEQCASGAVVIGRLKGEIGRKMMAEMNEHIGQAKTWCAYCGIKTGDREGLYAHCTSSAHIITETVKGGVIGQPPYRYPTLTMLVNARRKDLI